jgi:predicted acylesterase/phospholipase RssA/transcriptional regulator with XRE-family HTH domain
MAANTLASRIRKATYLVIITNYQGSRTMNLGFHLNQVASKKLKITNSKLALKLKISEKKLDNIYSGKTIPTKELVGLIANVTKTPVEKWERFRSADSRRRIEIRKAEKLRRSEQPARLKKQIDNIRAAGKKHKIPKKDLQKVIDTSIRLHSVLNKYLNVSVNFVDFNDYFVPPTNLNLPARPETTLLLQGGGTKGAFQAGALAYICKHWRAANITEVVGTSTGSLAALAVLARKEEAGKTMVVEATSLTNNSFPKSSKFIVLLHMAMLNPLISDLHIMIEKKIADELKLFPDFIMTDAPLDIRQYIPDPASLSSITSKVIEFIFSDSEGLELVHTVASVGNFLFHARDIAVFLAEQFRNTDGIYLRAEMEAKIAAFVAEVDRTIGLHSAVTSLKNDKLYFVDEEGKFRVEAIAAESNASNGDEIVPDLAKGILASAALPIAFTPTSVDRSDSPSKHMFTDGGVRQNCCLFKAHELAPKRIININCNPSPRKNWPPGNPFPTSGDLIQTVVAVSGHEQDLSEREPRNAFPQDKELVVIEPHKLLIGLLDLSKDCTLHALVTGYLRARIKLANINILERGICDNYLDTLEELLLAKSEIERKTYKPIDEYETDGPNRIFIPSIEKIREWRETTYEIYRCFVNLCGHMALALNTNKILPTKFNDLETTSIWEKVLSRTHNVPPTENLAASAVVVNNNTELWGNIYWQFPGHRTYTPLQKNKLLASEVPLWVALGSIPWDDPIDVPVVSSQTGIDNTPNAFK